MSRPKSNQVQETNSPFKNLRLGVKMSQESLAKEIGVAVSTQRFAQTAFLGGGWDALRPRRWEKGQAEPTMTVAQMKEFCRAVRQNFEELPPSLLPTS